MLSYPSSMQVSNRALARLAAALRHRRSIVGSRWRRLPAGRQALLVLAHLRKGETYTALAGGFRIGTTTVYRYVREGLDVLAEAAPTLEHAHVPLPDVQRILRSPDPGTRAALVSDHLQRLESELDRTRAAVASLRRLLRPEPAPLGVELRAVLVATVAVVEDDVEHDHIIDWYAGASG